MKLLISLCMILAANSVWARSKILMEKKPTTAPGVASVGVNWVKDKGEKYDFELEIKNERDKGIIVYLHEISCFRGADLGEAKHTFFNTGEKTIDFLPGETKKFILVCRFGRDVSGEYRVKVARIYDNDSNDGKTIGKVLAKDIEWKKE